MKWLYKAQREFPVHIVFVVKDAYTPGTEKILCWGDKGFLYVLKGTISISYRSKENDQKRYKLFKEKVKNKKFQEEIKRKTQEIKEFYDYETKKIREQCKKEQPWEQLSSLYKRAYNAEYQLLSIMNFTLYFEQAGAVPEEAKKIYEELQSETKEQTEIKGQTAYSGKVQGIVKKIK